MQILPMTTADYPEACALWRATPGMGLNAVDESAAGVARFLRRNPTTCFVARQDMQLCGVILCGHDGRRGHIYHAAVAAHMRGQGVGSALLDAALRGLMDEGICKVTLVAFADNVHGNAFWTSRGFSDRPDLRYRERTLAPLPPLEE